MSEHYKCDKCGSAKFKHDVTEVYEEEFNSELPAVIEGCGALIPGAKIKEFLSQMYDAYP
jgi:hypothetical protein